MSETNETEIDVDEVVMRLLPWKLGVKVKGVRYAVPPLTMAQLGLLMESAAANVKTDPAAMGRFRAAAASLFVPAPADDWELTHYQVAIQRVIKHFKEWQEKNSLLLAADAPAVAAAEARSTNHSTSGSSSRPS
jgi:hypothetical protein